MPAYYVQGKSALDVSRCACRPIIPYRSPLPFAGSNIECDPATAPRNTVVPDLPRFDTENGTRNHEWDRLHSFEVIVEEKTA
jgi:hypothetical protein